MAIKFVKTEILSSADGVSMGESKRLESPEADEALKLNGRGKSLFEQLSEQKDKEQESYDATTKLIFAPPKGLDDEEVAFFMSEETRRRAALKTRKESELDAFAAARAEFDDRDLQKSLFVGNIDHKTSTAEPPVKLRRKLKAEPQTKQHQTRENKKQDDPKQAPLPSSGGLSALLGVYAEGDSDDEGLPGDKKS